MTSSKPTGVKASNTSKIRISSYVVMALSGLMGGGSLILFGVFLYVGLPTQMDFGLHEQTNLYFDTLLCFLFFFQHSLMTRKGFRDWLTGFISPNFLGSFFSISSGLFLVILMLFWQKSTSVIYELDGTLYWLMRILFFLFINSLLKMISISHSINLTDYSGFILFC